MIGHYLLTLTPEQEDRVLTRPMGPFSVFGTRSPCLVQVVLDNGIGAIEACSIFALPGEYRHSDRLLPLRPIPRWTKYESTFIAYRRYPPPMCPASQYDVLCLRFGEARINASIRGRILSNQARRLGITGPTRVGRTAADGMVNPPPPAYQEIHYRTVG